ncbi:MAG: PRC-barrel domain-containing protein [Caldilineaceae bacterium]
MKTKRYTVVLAGVLLLCALILSACGDDTGAEVPPTVVPTIAVEATPTLEVAVTPAEVITGTEILTGTETMTGTEPMTGTSGISGSEELTGTDVMTDTEIMTGTETMTGTSGIGGSEEMTGTDIMTGTEPMTSTTGVSSAGAATMNRYGFPGAAGESVPASTIIGYDIRNSADEDLGSVEDLVVNLDSAQIHYVVVSFGGFLGLGDTYYAIPPEAFNWIPATAETDARLSIDITEQELQDAPVFTYDDDLNVAGWDAAIRNYWDSRLGTMTDTSPMTDTTSMGFPGAQGENVPATTLIGHSIDNSANENLGSIEDLIVKLESGQVDYVIVSFGGFLGIGDNYYAVPPREFTWIPATADSDSLLTIDITEAELQDAPTFSYDEDLNITGWDSAIQSYWDARSGG